MKTTILKDNSKYGTKYNNNSVVRKLVNLDLKHLDEQNFLIFPEQLSDSDNVAKDNYIFQLSNNELWTRNIVGILSDGTEEIQISSRFSNSKNKKDYLLRYLIQNVLDYNIVDNLADSDHVNSYYDLLVFLFPYYLNKAMRKGLYKEYARREYNDANVKGPINVAQQIKSNNPFMGKVAYSTREFSYDNNLTELIRHTIVKIESEHASILNSNETCKQNIRSIEQATVSYKKMDKLDVIRLNINNPIHHGYFKEYSVLQKLCLQILKEEKIGFGSDKFQIHGILIDVAWLWEEYIAKITGWKHYGRKQNLNTMYLFTDNSNRRYPDFVANGIPMDTKYKIHLDTRNDYNQMTTYLHIMGADRGGFLQPTYDSNAAGVEQLGYLNGDAGMIFTYRMFIPQDAESYEGFVTEMKKSEVKLINVI